jgi:hypothetical protein
VSRVQAPVDVFLDNLTLPFGTLDMALWALRGDE